MRKKLFYITNQNGFFLPYVLFIISLTLLIVSANIKIYHNEIYMMNQLTEQIKVESLIQMGHMKYKHEMMNNEKFPETILYTFPLGDVKVSYISHKDNLVLVRYHVTTNKDIPFTIKSYINLDEKQKKYRDTKKI